MKKHAKKNTKIVFNRFIKNENHHGTWDIKAYFKTADEAKAALAAIRQCGDCLISKARIRGRGKWTYEKMSEWVTHMMKKHKNMKLHLPDDMPAAIADYVVLYIYY